MLLGNYFKNINKNFKNLFFSGISFDTRKIKKNYIFFAIKGSRFDGNDYILDASRGGIVHALDSHKLDEYVLEELRKDAPSE